MLLFGFCSATNFPEKNINEMNWLKTSNVTESDEEIITTLQDPIEFDTMDNGKLTQFLKLPHNYLT